MAELADGGGGFRFPVARERGSAAGSAAELSVLGALLVVRPRPVLVLVVGALLVLRALLLSSVSAVDYPVGGMGARTASASGFSVAVGDAGLVGDAGPPPHNSETMHTASVWVGTASQAEVVTRPVIGEDEDLGR